MTSAPHTCASCAHFSRPADDRLVAVSAFGRCVKMPVGYYRAPTAPCKFTPSRWRAARA